MLPFKKHLICIIFILIKRLLSKYFAIDNNFFIFVVSNKRALWMTDEEALKARVEELIENLNYYLRNYHRLIGLGYRKSVLDAEIECLKLEIQRLSAIR